MTEQLTEIQEQDLNGTEAVSDVNAIVTRPRVLVACEYSGIVREAFATAGCDAWSCDFEDTDIPGQHIKGDVLEVINDGWDAMIAHPPCTRLTNSVWWYILQNDLHDEVEEAAGFFNDLWNAPIPCIGMENPIPNKGAREYLPSYNQIIQPWQFGDDASKATCLWLKNLPPLLSMQFCEPRWADGKPRWSNQTDGGWNKLGPSDDRSKERARFWPGVAKAMAEQWLPTIMQKAG